MKQTKQDFNNGYNRAVEIVRDRIERGEKLEFVLQDEGYMCPYYPSFFVNDKRDFVIIKTQFGRGYEQALVDMEKSYNKVIHNYKKRNCRIIIKTSNKKGRSKQMSIEPMYDIRKQCLNQLKAFESYFNKRKEKIGVKRSKRIEKHLAKIRKELL